MTRLGVSGDELDVTHRRSGQRRVLHDGDLTGELREQPHAAVDDVVEVEGAVEEALDRTPLGRGERAHLGEPVDEQAVALVGGDAPGRGVRLRDEAFVLERGHVVADGGRRDVQVVTVDQRPRADRLVGGDVVLDDGAQHGEPAILDHPRTSCSRPLPVAPTRRAGTYLFECQL